MDDLELCRCEIDKIDKALIELLEQRIKTVHRVADYKKIHNMGVLQPSREEEVLQKACETLVDKSYSPQACKFMDVVMEISREAQHCDLKINEKNLNCIYPQVFAPKGACGYPGVAGSFSEEALFELLGDERERRAYEEFEDVFEALHIGEISCGVLPIENSSTGSISKVYDLLGKYGFCIIGECSLGIRQNLVSVDGASLETIRVVYSHAQAIEQSSLFLSKHKQWETVHFHNTAISAKRVANENDPSKAAIASFRAADEYGLKIIASDIQNNSLNTTRFILIGKKFGVGTGKISIAFSIDNGAGTLYSVLRHFFEQHINMVKIESRPIPDSLWNYRFYLDFEGEPKESNVQALLESLSSETKDLQILGAYAPGCKKERGISCAIKMPK